MEIDKVFEQLRERGLMHENTEQSRTQEYVRTDFENESKKMISTLEQNNSAEHQNSFRTETEQNIGETTEEQLSLFDIISEQEYEPKKIEKEVQLSFTDYIAARKAELDTYRLVAEICLDCININTAVDKQREELTEILVKNFDENLHSREPIITEQDLQECIEKNHVNTWLADFVNEMMEENILPEQNYQKKQQIQYSDF